MWNSHYWAAHYWAPRYWAKEADFGDGDASVPQPAHKRKRRDF